MSDLIVNDEKYFLSVGMCVMDIVQVCSSYPIEDSDKRSKHGHWQRGGNASNVCTVLAELGIKCEYLGSLSEAKWFQFIINDMIPRGIRVSDACAFHDCEAPISSVILNEATSTRTIIHSNPDLPVFSFEDFKKVNLNGYRWIHFEGRNPEETSQMMNFVFSWNSKQPKSNRIVISLDLEKQRPNIFGMVDYADIVFLGRDLAESLGYSDKTLAVYEFRAKTRNGYTIITTWGTDGVAVLDSNDQLFCCGTFPPENVVDTLGAGDTFTASTIFALIRQKGMQEAIDFASRVAGAKVGFFGYDGIGKIANKLLEN